MANSGALVPIQQNLNPPAKVELPKINIDILNDHPVCFSDYQLPPNYIKFNEKTSEELDEEVEYDMDVEDNVWLKIINEQREDDPDVKDKTPIMQEQFEFLMDRLEKESYFQAAAHSPQKNPNASPSLNSSRLHNDSTCDDALCCICLDGECSNSNVILFCDMCNLAVHQECYGVPYIPEGQWLCRKCIQSPSAPVNCILCPNKFGAFKQTDHNEWAHVVCAIWIPEVHFANTVFLEPIIGTENIDRARWKLMCYICRKRNVGACIQCDKQNCYTAFHVTCAQQAGLYMNIQEECLEAETVGRGRKKKEKNNDANSSSSFVGEVRKCAYCDMHTPLEIPSPKSKKNNTKAGNPNSNSSDYKEIAKQAQKERMKKARKILAEQRKAPPVVSLPVISKEKIESILSNFEFDNKEKFMEKLVNYWLLKRYARNGVPILRRLQNLRKQKNENNDFRSKKEEELDAEKILELKEKHSHWKKVRQDLERARLLMELIRKRERNKRDIIRLDHLQTMYEINPFNGIFLQRILDIVVEFDTKLIFTQPVDPIEVPTYYEFIQHPMDLSKMQKKLDDLEYDTFEQFEADFDLMIDNCLRFNAKNNYYYKAGIKLKEQANAIFKIAKKFCESTKTATDFIQMISDSKITEKNLSEIRALLNIEVDKNAASEAKSDKKTSKLNTPSTTSKKSTSKISTPATSTTNKTRQTTLQFNSEKIPTRTSSVLSQVKNENVQKNEKKIDNRKSPNKNTITTTPVKSEPIKQNRKSLRVNKDIFSSIEEAEKEEEKSPTIETKKEVKSERRNSLRSADIKDDGKIDQNESQEKREENKLVTPKKRTRHSELENLKMWAITSGNSPSRRQRTPRQNELNKSEVVEDEMDSNSMRVEMDDLDQTEDERLNSSKIQNNTRRRSSRKSMTKGDIDEKPIENEAFTDVKKSEVKEENTEEQNGSEIVPSKTGVNRRTAVLFKRNKSNSLVKKTSSSALTTKNENPSNKKNDSVSDISTSDSNNKDLMNISGSTNQTNESN
ncbi:unnamed protein product [Brachionus calyciflorus]|uniref:Uncharacterized protein n=1 Tax=Brachionus calyciflorus TaxID=104777 RepID=A0A813S228_9BILA|nr:unnamed protein product [Brachionus calyciflorus]